MGLCNGTMVAGIEWRQQGAVEVLWYRWRNHRESRATALWPLHVYPTFPPRRRYSLTDTGRSFFHIVQALLTGRPTRPFIRAARFGYDWQRPFGRLAAINSPEAQRQSIHTGAPSTRMGTRSLARRRTHDAIFLPASRPPTRSRKAKKKRKEKNPRPPQNNKQQPRAEGAKNFCPELVAGTRRSAEHLSHNTCQNRTPTDPTLEEANTNDMATIPITRADDLRIRLREAARPARAVSVPLCVAGGDVCCLRGIFVACVH